VRRGGISKPHNLHGRITMFAVRPGMLELHVYVEVADLDAGLAFYTSGLGLHEVRRFTERWVELGGAGVPLHLLARPDPSFTAGAHRLTRSYARHWTPVHLDLVVDDLEVALESALAAGATQDREIVDHHFWRMANLADPFGNGIDLIQLAHGGYEAFIASRSGLPTRK
jgi:catechol 2,3-dioxygenase-like lactoylglutathione lyase family enzyme